MTLTRAVQAAIAEPWAITADGLDLVLAIAGREHTVTPEALEAYRGQHVPQSERLKQRGPVAVMQIRGPMFRYASMFTAISGATSYEGLRRDLQTAMDDPSISAILLDFDTPGGEVTGVSEMGAAIKAASQKKHVVAFVGGSAASAGYWMASQASEIVISPTAILGSIGVRAVVQDTSKADAEKGRLEFISSQSPGKRSDVSSDDGKARIQKTIDALADVFISAVASGRGVDAKDVTEKFGGGDVLVGSAAIAAGMADRLGEYEAVVSELAARRATPQTHKGSSAMDEKTFTATEHHAAVSAARAEGVTAERARITGIMALPEAKGNEAFAQHIAMTTDMSAEVAKGILAGHAATAPKAAEPDPVVVKTGLVLDMPEASGGLQTSEAKKQAAIDADWSAVIKQLNG